MSRHRDVAFCVYEAKCDNCGVTDADGSPLHVHHKDLNPGNNDATNLRILCPPCHYREHIAIRSRRIPFVHQTVSLRRDQLAAATAVARADFNGFLSQYIQKLVTDDLRSRFGRDWSRDFTEKQEGDAA